MALPFTAPLIAIADIEGVSGSVSSKLDDKLVVTSSRWSPRFSDICMKQFDMVKLLDIIRYSERDMVRCRRCIMAMKLLEIAHLARPAQLHDAMTAKI